MIKLKAPLFILVTLMVLLTLYSMIDLSLSIEASSNVILVPQDFQTIQGAINAANPGDTIFVYNGTYRENLVVDKSVTLIGQDNALTTIDGDATGTVISVTANNVAISNFTIQNACLGCIGGDIYDSGIFLDQTTGNTISNNVILNNGVGIWLYHASNVVLYGNSIRNNNYGLWLDHSGNNHLVDNNLVGNLRNIRVYGDADPHYDNTIGESNQVNGKAIYYLKEVTNMVYDAQTNAGVYYLINCNNITVKDVSLSNNEYGVLLWHTTNSKIENIESSDNSFGIALFYSSGNMVSNNTVYANTEHGIYLYHSSDSNVVAGNRISSNGIYGIYLSLSNNNRISDNLVTTNEYEGIHLSRSNNNLLSNNRALDNWDGISISYYCDSNVVSGNLVSLNEYDGISLSHNSINNLISGNIASKNNGGISLYYSCDNNTVTNNTILNNNIGIDIFYSRDNLIYHNNLLNNSGQVGAASPNIWDDGSTGNYWSTYGEIDSEQDGIGDTPYSVGMDNQDNFPLMGMFWSFTLTPEYFVNVICNSTLSDFMFDPTHIAIRFNVTGQEDTIGFCRIYIPTALMNTYTVFVNNTEIEYSLLPYSNSTHSYLYFTYPHSTHEVAIIPTVLSDYYELLREYLQLQANYTLVNTDYTTLHTNFTKLQEDYTSMHASFQNMSTEFNTLQLDQNLIIHELGIIINYLYLFIVVTVIIVIVIYLAKKTNLFRNLRGQTGRVDIIDENSG